MDKLREALVILGIDEWAVYGNPTQASHLKKVAKLPTEKPDDGDYVYIKSSESATWTDIENAMTTYDNREYQRKRVLEYPSIADQLDDLYHNGIDGWKTTIKTVKDKYPKG